MASKNQTVLKFLLVCSSLLLCFSIMFVHVWAVDNGCYASVRLQASVDNVVINEVELNPSGNDNYLSVEEWVELYNPTASDVDISDWTLSTTHGTIEVFTIPQGTILAADGYYVFGSGSQWLDNEDESVVLRDDEGTEIDRTPTISDEGNGYPSWQRYPNGGDNWSFRWSTKNATNGGDTQAPTIGDVNQSPSEDSVEPEDEVTVNAVVSDYDSGVNKVTLNYTQNGGDWFSIEMTNTAGNSWSATIPAFPEDTSVTYVIIAEDNAENIITSEGYTYGYQVIPELTGIIMLSVFVIVTSFVLISKKVSLY